MYMYICTYITSVFGVAILNTQHSTKSYSRAIAVLDLFELVTRHVLYICIYIYIY